MHKAERSVFVQASSPDFTFAAELPVRRRVDYERSQAAQHCRFRNEFFLLWFDQVMNRRKNL